MQKDPAMYKKEWNSWYLTRKKVPFIDIATRDESRRSLGRRNGRGCNQLEARPQPPYDLQCREKPRTKDVRDCCTLTCIFRKRDVAKWGSKFTKIHSMFKNDSYKIYKVCIKCPHSWTTSDSMTHWKACCSKTRSLSRVPQSFNTLLITNR